LIRHFYRDLLILFYYFSGQLSVSQCELYWVDIMLTFVKINDNYDENVT